jgi:hypothetical protein
MRLSAKTKQRLVRYANAVQQYETKRQKVYFADGSHSETSPSAPIVNEWVDARDDLKNCPEPKIKKLVHRIQIDRLDDTRSRIGVMKVVDAYRLAENELIALGHKLKGAGKSSRLRRSANKKRPENRH